MSDTELLPKPKREPRGRFTGWRCLPGPSGAAVGPRSRRRGSSPRVMRAARRYARLRAGTG